MNKYKDVFITTTDTVMGIGVPIDKNDGSLIFELKHRDNNKPLIMAIGSIDQAREFKEWNNLAEEHAQKDWPGAVSLVLTKDIAFRIPDNDQLRELLIEKGPCYLTSANISGQPPVKTIKEAKSLFPEVTEFHDFGEMNNEPSAIIDVNTGQVLR